MDRQNAAIMQAEQSRQFQTDDSYIIVKAAPRASKANGETVCIAGLNSDGSWVRLYPVSFKDLKEGQRFGRWDQVRYRWRRPTGISDLRDESRRVDSQSIEIVGTMPLKERHSFLRRVAVTSLQRERELGKSLALLRPEVDAFFYKRKSTDDLAQEQGVRDELRAQSDMFTRDVVIPKEICPFAFFYSYRDDDGHHTGTCQDWETEATFLRRRRKMGESAALNWMQEMFGERYVERGMALAMGTHRYRHDQWLINGIIRIDDSSQLTLL